MAPRPGNARFAAIETPPLPRGTMPPLHARDRDERYEVLEGEVVFSIGRERIVAAAGDVVTAPGGVARTFRVASPTARWVLVTELASLARYVRRSASPGA